MWVVLSFLAAAIIGTAAVLGASRRGSAVRYDYPWLLDEVWKLHVGIVGTLAGFAFTGIVLVVTLARERPSAAQDTVVVMFLISYLYWVGSAFLISYLPHARLSADLMQRIHFSLASTIEYRTVFLSWFALVPLVQAYGLSRLSPLLAFLLPASLLLGSLLLAMATDGLGLMQVKEIYLSAGIGTALALAYGAVATWIVPGARTNYSSLYLAVVMFCVNGASFALAATTPLSERYAGVKKFYELHGRRIVVADMQLTMLSLSFLWLAVVGVI